MLSSWFSANCTAGVGPQSLVAVTVAAAGIMPHPTVTSAGTPTSRGADVSSTTIVCTTVLPLPQASVAVQVRVSVYCVAQLPGRLSCAKLRIGSAVQSSLVFGVANTGTAAQLTRKSSA